MCRILIATRTLLKLFKGKAFDFYAIIWVYNEVSNLVINSAF